MTPQCVSAQSRPRTPGLHQLCFAGPTRFEQRPSAPGPDRSAARVKLNDGSSAHMAPYMNQLLNSNLEHNSTDWVRRVRRGSSKTTPYKGDCKVKNVQSGAVWQQCINEAGVILAIHPSIGTQRTTGIFVQLFLEGATLLKPKGRSLQKEVDEEKKVSVVVEEVPETSVRVNPSSELPEGHVWESFLQIAHRPDRLAAYVKINDGSSVQMAPYINQFFNSNLEHNSTYRVRRVTSEGQYPGPRVAPPPVDDVAPGTPFATLVTYNSPSKGT